MSRVRRFRDGSVGLHFEPQEASVLRELLEQYGRLIDTARSGEDAALHDPALARLFPAAYADPAQQARFRQDGGAEAAGRRLADAAALLRLLDLGGAAGRDADRIGPEEVPEVVRALNAIRLVLASRLEVLTEEDAAAVRTDEPIGAIYQWLGMLLEQLMSATR